MNPSTQTAGLPGAPHDGEAQQAKTPRHDLANGSAAEQALPAVCDLMAYMVTLAHAVERAMRAASIVNEADEPELADEVLACAGFVQMMLAYLADRTEHAASGRMHTASDLAAWVFPPNVVHKLRDLERGALQ